LTYKVKWSTAVIEITALDAVFPEGVLKDFRNATVPDVPLEFAVQIQDADAKPLADMSFRTTSLPLGRDERPARTSSLPK
jgi:hypothetical protein